MADNDMESLDRDAPGRPSRRRFLRGLAAAGCAAAMGPLAAACRRGEPPATATPTATRRLEAQSPTPVRTAAPTAEAGPTSSRPAGAGRATVALVATTDRAVGARSAIELLELGPLNGGGVLVKPNLNSADPAPGSTHPEVLRALLEALQALGAGPISIGDRSGMGRTREVMRQTGVLDLAAELGARTVVFDDLPEDAWRLVEAQGFHWARGFPVPRLLDQVEAVVQTCNLKTHAHGGHFTMSLKNSVGLVAKSLGGYDFMDELHASPDQRRMIAEVNTAYTPALVVVDGVEAFVRGGPDQGTMAATGVVLAGTDRVALDAVGVAILRLFGTTDEVTAGRVFDQEQIARAVELGLGVGDPSRIVFACPDEASRRYEARVREALAG